MAGVQPYTGSSNLPQPSYEQWNRPFTPYTQSQYPWGDAWRKADAANNWANLDYRKTGVDRTMAQSGLNFSPGYRESFMNPAYQEFNQANMQSNAQIGRAEEEAWLQLEQMRREEEMQKEANKYGLLNGIFGGVADLAGFALPWSKWLGGGDA